MKIAQQIESAAEAFLSSGLPTPRLDAEVLLASFLGKDRTWLFVHSDRDMSDPETEGSAPGWQGGSRVNRWPIWWGIRNSGPWNLPWTPGSDPRPDTEILVEEVLNVPALNRAPCPGILELGTGSGAIAVSLASERADARITATDISPGALAVAAANAARNLGNSRIQFLQGDLFSPVQGDFDVIVSNPPYIAVEDFSRLSREIRDFEPRQALLAGREGMDFYSDIIPQAPRYLKPGGWLLLEIGDGQQQLVEDLLSRSGLYREVAFRKDYAGRWRVAKARKRGSKRG
jgi:release factor glutamine methyltransferase